ncbi:MAG: hypothetical protein IKU47_03280 [Oscillospiraceae bacterium]|nr:hypothetical protein [Oscillospiraceae bacterium]
MKTLIVGCIDCIYEFDNIASFDRYINNIAGKYAYKVVKQTVKADGTIVARIKRRYNSNAKFMEMDGKNYL